MLRDKFTTVDIDNRQQYNANHETELTGAWNNL